MTELERNKIFWESNLSGAVQFTYEEFLNSSLESDIDSHSSLEERGQIFLENSFHWLMLGEYTKSQQVGEYAALLCNKGIELKSYVRYGYELSQGNTLQIRGYELEGELRSRRLLRIHEVIQGTLENTMQVSAINVAKEYWYEIAEKEKWLSKYFVDNYGFVFLMLDAYEDFISLCESSQKLKFDIKRMPNINNIGSRVYAVCHSILERDEVALNKLLIPHLSHSKRWYGFYGQYPWWECIGWFYTYYRICKNDQDISNMWQELKGVSR